MPPAFFKRPRFALDVSETPETPPQDRTRSSANATDSPAAETSPLTELPSSSSFLSDNASPLPSEGPASRLNQPQWRPVKEEPDVEAPPHCFQRADTIVAGNPSEDASFTSRRTARDGKEVVISSDGEDTDSIASLEAPEDLFAKITGSGPRVVKEINPDLDGSKETLRSGRPKKDVKPIKFSVPRYKNTLDSLVTDAVDDNETEAGIARLRATINKSEEDAAAAMTPDDQDSQLHEGMLTSALGDKDDELGLQRLLAAVRRTEAFDQDKAWSFFSDKAAPPPAMEFPRDCVAPGTYMAVLREPYSRERAFHSGIVELALSKRFLPDELAYWIFHTVPSESRDGLRHAYCRVFKHVTAERVKMLIRPDDIDMLFQRLGASAKALAVTKPVSPDSTESVPSQGGPNNQTALLSVLELLREAADLFADDTRERILIILFRLMLDISLTKNAIVCAELERAITAALEGIPEDGADDLVYRISTSLYDTIKDSALQSRLLRHTLPTSSWISLLRCRLAVAYVIRDPSPLTEPPEAVLNINRLINVLKGPRFAVKLHKGKGRADYDYGELSAVTTLLNIAIDAGWSALGFPSKEAERTFNAEIDELADRIKKIFASIEDSGVSHLKRTLAKEGLEALHYRVLYSVRSKPQPKKPIFKEYKTQAEHRKISAYFKTAEGSNENTGIPIREHENPS